MRNFFPHTKKLSANLLLKGENKERKYEFFTQLSTIAKVQTKHVLCHVSSAFLPADVVTTMPASGSVFPDGAASLSFAPPAAIEDTWVSLEAKLKSCVCLSQEAWTLAKSAANCGAIIFQRLDYSSPQLILRNWFMHSFHPGWTTPMLFLQDYLNNH